MSQIEYSSKIFKIENIIYGSFVKKQKLEELTIKTFSNTSIASATELNIFIDLYSVIKSIFSEHYRVDVSDYTAITSGVINMCSHYRSFYKTLGVKTNFYIIESLNTCDINRKFVAEYNAVFYGKSQIPLFNQLANSNFDILELLCKYLPDIYFIRSKRNYESSVIMAHLIETLPSGIPNLIISRDLYPIQLCYLYPYTAYLWPHKRGSEDVSVMIPISEKPSFSYEFWNHIANLRGFNINKLNGISPLNFVLFSALHKFPERNLARVICNITGTVDVITRIAGNNNIKIIPEQLYNDELIGRSLPVASIESIMKTLDVEFMLPFYRNDPESKSIRFENLRDDATINMINAKFFSHNPIDINRL